VTGTSRARGTALERACDDLTAILVEEQHSQPGPIGFGVTKRPSVGYLVDKFSERAKGLPAGEMLDELLLAVAPNRGPALLWRWWTRSDVDSSVLARLILLVWSLTDCPEQDLGQRRWLELFRATGYVSLNDAPPQRGPLLIYRGAPERYRRRMAWTTDPEIACRFATMTTRSPGEVWRSTVPPHAVLARFYESGGRSEAEVIVNPNCLRGEATPRRVIETLR
jgi:hypothetical protein